MAQPIIELSDLQKEYGPGTVAVDHLSMSIPPGQIFGFLGANGAGKTTTIRMLCGLTKPTSGRGFISSHDIWTDRYKIRTQFGYVAQRFSLYPDLTVLENIRFFGGASRVPPQLLQKRASRLLAEMDLEEKRNAMAGSLSGGMRQLLALACALIHEPPLLFLDEPTAGLDPVHRQQMWDLLYNLSNAGATIFVTTHYMDEADRCTEVGFLDRGKLLVKESPRVLRESFKGRLLELNVEPVMPALAILRNAPGVLGVSFRSERIRVYAPDSERLLASWQKEWPWREIALIGHQWIEPDMEDVFKAYSQGYHEILR